MKQRQKDNMSLLRLLNCVCMGVHVCALWEMYCMNGGHICFLLKAICPFNIHLHCNCAFYNHFFTEHNIIRVSSLVVLWFNWSKCKQVVKYPFSATLWAIIYITPLNVCVYTVPIHCSSVHCYDYEHLLKGVKQQKTMCNK